VSVSRADHSVQELRQLIALLEQSGMAQQRPEVRALLERSRAMLRRRQPAPARFAGKLGSLLVFALDAVLLSALPLVLILMLSDAEIPGPALAVAILAPLWACLRLRRHAHWLAEGLRYLSYHLAWGWDWFAEVFSSRAILRLEARITAREVMAGWRQHRRTLARQPPLTHGLADVEGFLALSYGEQAALEFRRAADAVCQARDWTLRGSATRNRAGDRLAGLRWSALILQFGNLARSGALWTDFAPQPLIEAALGQAPPAVHRRPQAGPEAGSEAGSEAPELAARRLDLRDLVRRKRQDITTAFGWKLKTEAEIAQRDAYLAQTRAEIAALERELAALGG